jgi:integrase/recombinase XerD
VNIVRQIDPPDVKPPVVETLSKDDLEKLLGACAVTRGWKSRDYKPQERPTADRHRAIILLLVETGLRASELCGIKIGDLNLNANSIKVLGKGNKERLVYFGKRTSQALWKLLTPRLNEARQTSSCSPLGRMTTSGR